MRLGTAFPHLLWLCVVHRVVLRLLDRHRILAFIGYRGSRRFSADQERENHVLIGLTRPTTTLHHGSENTTGLEWTSL